MQVAETLEPRLDVSRVERAPLLSIVVPTRNRPDYAYAAVRALLAIPEYDFEVVVEDNSDDSILELGLGVIADPRLNYRRDATPRSMSENFEAAVLRARGEYVALIGDDDSVNPEILSAARWARDRDVDSLSSSTPAHYVWPDLNMPWSGAIQGSELRVSRFSSAIRRVEARIELHKCLRQAGQSLGLMPRPYYGVVKRSCYTRVRELAGACFPGVSPDLAGAVALVAVVRESYYVDYPLFLPGSSARSNAGLSGMKRHVGELRDQQHLPKGCESRWSVVVPAFYSVETIWAEAAVSALLATGQGSRLKEFNVPYLYAWLLIFYPRFRRRVLRQFKPALAAVGLSMIEGIARCIYHGGLIWALRARFLVRRLLPGRATPPLFRNGGLTSVQQAAEELGDYVRRSGQRFPAKA